MGCVLLIHRSNINFGNGGVERYVRSQIFQLNENNISCYVLFPVRKKTLGIKFEYWGLMYNQTFLGAYLFDEVYCFFNKLLSENKIMDVYIHHLMNINIKKLIILIESLKNVSATFYIHDYYSACIQYNLLKNKEKYCGSAYQNDDKCNDCKFHSQSKRLKMEIQNLFYVLKDNIKFIAPSNFTKELWLEAYPQYSNKVEVVPHLQLTGEYKGNKGKLAWKNAIKIAFLGSQDKKKGWEEWLAATNDMNNSATELFYLGDKIDNRVNIKSIFVSIERGGATAMMDALRKEQIDCVVLFSICPETYSYTYYEALSANCFVITNFNSGNIAQEVKKRKNGIVIQESTESLKALLKNTELLRKSINEFRLSAPYGPLTLRNNIHRLEKNLHTMERANRPRRKFSMARNLFEKLYRFRYSDFMNGDILNV